MSTQTPNLNLDLREASDIFNPLSTNSNFETLDSVIDNIQKKGGVPTYTTTASANLLKLSENPTPNETVFKFVAAGDANTWSYQETVNNIVSLDGAQKTVKAGEMYVAWVNAANAMVVIAWPDVVNAQTFDGKGPAEWATTAQLQAVNQTAQNATTTAQAAATVANNALGVAEKAQQAAENAGFSPELLWTNSNPTSEMSSGTSLYDGDLSNYKYIFAVVRAMASSSDIFLTYLIPIVTSGSFMQAMLYYPSPTFTAGSGYCVRHLEVSATNVKLAVFEYAQSGISKDKLLIPYQIYGVK